MTNTSTSTYWLTVSVKEYVYDSGFEQMSDDYGTLSPGLQVATEKITRYTDSYVRYYLHTGNCSVGSSYPSTVDDYSYTGNQYYD